ncbi:hypothetical protein F170042I7_20330 [Blautia caecimuris]|uniref:hypothetical protein n=1 Tax=Blautia caecimuris TaxID=1796615 RepID=UPI0034B7645C
MAMTNDDKIMQLKAIIEKKKEELKKYKKFCPVTNCVLDLDGKKYNLNVLQENELVLLLVKLDSYFVSAERLHVILILSGYDVLDWIEDIRDKLRDIEKKKKESELKKMESKLTALLSDNKKTELELSDMETILNKF